MVTARRVNASDIEDIRTAVLTAHSSGGKVKRWLKDVDIPTVMSVLTTNPDVAIINEQFIVYAAAAIPWYGTEPIVAEHIVLRIRKGDDDLGCVVSALRGMAFAVKAKRIVVGTALSPRDLTLARVYQRKGDFQLASVELDMEL